MTADVFFHALEADPDSGPQGAAAEEAMDSEPVLLELAPAKPRTGIETPDLGPALAALAKGMPTEKSPSRPASIPFIALPAASAWSWPQTTIAAPPPSPPRPMPTRKKETLKVTLLEGSATQ